MENPNPAYVYSYPHKLAYEPLDPAIELGPLWRCEDKSQLFLYWHIPFCEMRCGFCNLFTSVENDPDVMYRYLQALRRQSQQMMELLGAEHRVVSLAIGGGTPTHLPELLLQELLEIDASWTRQTGAPFSCETSPATATTPKLKLLRQAGVSRISMGVQSFVAAETQAVHRGQELGQLLKALERIRALDFAVLNLDLMIGLPGQTPESLLQSLRQALHWLPEELYVYPLYVRPFTRLHLHNEAGRDQDGSLYRLARDFLESHGYRQVSLRMYRRRDCAGHRGEYVCQRDGMLGLGCGARSYTRALHYSSLYAVGSKGVRRILRHYLENENFGLADYGYRLDEQEQKRRFAVISLLSEEGLQEELYRARFETSPLQDFPVIDELRAQGWVQGASPWTLTRDGLEHADSIGPRFFSSRVLEALAQGAVE